MITPEWMSALLTSFLLCVTVPLLSGLIVTSLRSFFIPLVTSSILSPEVSTNTFCKVVAMCCCLNIFFPALEDGRVGQIFAFLDRHLGPLIFWRQKVNVIWPEDWQAANTKVIKFLLDSAEGVRVEIKCQGDPLHATQLFEEGELQVIFPAKKCGEYQISLWIHDEEVRCSPWVRHILPGHPHPPSCRVVGAWVSRGGVVVPAGGSTQSLLQVKDRFGNPVNCSRRDFVDVKLVIDTPEAKSSVDSNRNSADLELEIETSSSAIGAFPLSVWYKDELMIKTNLLVLNQTTIAELQNSLRDAGNYTWNSYYTVNLVKLAGVVQTRPRTVYVYLKEKQLIIKEYFLKFIPRRIASYRVNPKVNLLVRWDEEKLDIQQTDVQGLETVLHGEPVLRLAAAYYMILGKRLGNAGSFSDRRDHFYTALMNHHTHKGHKHVRIPLVIDRNLILESTFRATRYFLESDWARLFFIRFDGEAGQDQGGLRREWMELVTRYIFDPRNEMFLPLEEEGPGLQPNPFPPPHIKLKHYRLAGKLVGKCLYESSLGKTYRLNLNAQLAKSFLTQIIGLDVSYSMLEADAPNLFSSKVKYILENSVAGLDLTFTQEEVKAGARLSIEICPGGANKEVTDENKTEYVHQLGKYLMVDRIHKQVQAFSEGVHTLVPSELLTLWDEGELELLLCGLRSYNLATLKQNYVLVGARTPRFDRVLRWLWEALSHFSNEDMARFVQFITGSSLLPPGGWAELSPSLQISLGGGSGSLPTSHTCFNLLVLPEAASYQELERVLLLAVREGSEGFLLA